MDFINWISNRMSAMTNGVRRTWQGLNGEPSDYDKQQNVKIIENTNDIRANQERQTKKDYNQDIQIQRVQGDIKELANRLGLDPNNVSTESIRNRVTEITNDTELTRLSEETKNSVRLSYEVLTPQQRKMLEDELNMLEKAWKEYQKPGSKFNLDDPNTLNIISKLMGVQDFMGQTRRLHEEDPNYRPDYISGMASALRDTTNRIKSGLRAELPTNERTLVSA